MNNKITFWKLLDNYEIEIPIIQRDYAQGRDDSKTESIRKEFVSELFNMIISKDKTKDLNFIYGSVIDDKLILLDGQQRLTTLYLLYWYIAVRTENFDEKFSKFKYLTRTSAKEFCNFLYTNLKNSDFNFSFETNKLSDEIKDSIDYYYVWNLDPTVISMLTMLDEIHLIYSSLEINSNIWQCLTDTKYPPITFYFLDMDKFQLTDELYIKMNSRGKELSSFENFKAWILGYSLNHKLNIPDNFWLDIDKKWTDLFWNLKSNSEYEIDKIYLKFFKHYFLFNHCVLIDLNKYLTEDKKKLIDFQDSNIKKLRDNSYIPLKSYTDFIKSNLLLEIKEILDFFVEYKDEILFKYQNNKTLANFLKDFFSKEKLTYEDHLVIIAISTFKIKISGEIDVIQFRRWMRLILNFIYNTNFDSSLDFVKAVKLIWSYSEMLKGNSIYQQIEIINKFNIEPFSKDQREEEILKAQLVLANPNWETLFEKSEANDYFKGQIGFVLNYSKENSKFDIFKFERYFDKLDCIFPKMLKDDSLLFHRALLSKGDFSIKSSGYNKRNFCKDAYNSNRAKDESWRKVFKDVKKSNILKLLLDDISEDSTIEKFFDKIIGEYQYLENDWRYYFIKFSEILKCCSNKQFKLNSNNEIYLARSSGEGWRRKAELYSYYFYKIVLKGTELKKLGNANYYFSSNDDLPCIYFQFTVDNCEIELQVGYEKGFYILIHIDDNIAIEKYIKDKYNSYAFEHTNNGYEMLNIIEDDLLNIVKQIDIDLETKK